MKEEKGEVEERNNVEKPVKLLEPSESVIKVGSQNLIF